MSFENKVAFVTGGTSGIGEATAILFAKEKANVVIVGRNESKLNEVASKCDKSGKRVLAIKADVANDDEIQSAIEKTIEKFGKLDILVNNAGFAPGGAILDGKILDAYEKTMAVNMRAVVLATMVAAPHLAKTKGNIINISSIAGTMSPILAQALPYCVSKAALDHFSRGAAVELATVGVRVNVVSPGPVKTNFFDNNMPSFSWKVIQENTLLNRISQAEEIADLILYLASDKAVGITGSVIVSDNGVMLKRK